MHPRTGRTHTAASLRKEAEGWSAGGANRSSPCSSLLPLPAPGSGSNPGFWSRQPSPLLRSEGARLQGCRSGGSSFLRVSRRRPVPGCGVGEENRGARAAPDGRSSRAGASNSHSRGLRGHTSQSNPRGRRYRPGESPLKPSVLPQLLFVPRSENPESPRSLRQAPAATRVRGLPVEQGERVLPSPLHFVTWPLLGLRWRAAEVHQCGGEAAASEHFQIL